MPGQKKCGIRAEETIGWMCVGAPLPVKWSWGRAMPAPEEIVLDIDARFW